MIGPQHGVLVERLAVGVANGFRWPAEIRRAAAMYADQDTV